jgi:predicted Zn-ribbon and HTH transcriptional regulator
MPVKPNIIIKIKCLDCGWKMKVKPKSDVLNFPSKCKKCESPNLKRKTVPGNFFTKFFP